MLCSWRSNHAIHPTKKLCSTETTHIVYRYLIDILLVTSWYEMPLLIGMFALLKVNAKPLGTVARLGKRVSTMEREAAERHFAQAIYRALNPQQTTNQYLTFFFEVPKLQLL